MQCFEFLRPSYWSNLTFFVVNLWDEKAQVYKVKQITQLCQRIKKKKKNTVFCQSCITLLHDMGILFWFWFSCFGFVWNLTFFIDCKYFFSKINHFHWNLWTNLCSLQSLPFLWITTVRKVNPRSYELPANPIKLILIQILILNQEINFSGFILFFWIQFLMFFLFLGLWFSFFVQIFFSFLL